MTTLNLKYDAATTGIANVEMVDGNAIPILGFGTYKLDDEQARESVRYALEIGYRHIDTASLYRNERGVGQGIADAVAANVVKREDIFVTTKVWNGSAL
ncbi:aldo/keto reductase [Corynebacterium amycolatum]|uniref:aldo/keto reductase n=1 Tax=Corynebacterium amycolatum TaxID=43765 RepID=UPI003AF7DDC4